MARPEEPLNHENLSLIVALYQRIVAADPKAWVKSKAKGPAHRSVLGQAITPPRPCRGRITREVSGYKVTVMCETGGPELIIRMSAPGWAVNLRAILFTGREHQRGYDIFRMGDMFRSRVHFTNATAQGLEKFKHQMTLIALFSELEAHGPATSGGSFW